MKRAHVFYSGDVQGVGFRFTAVDEAKKYGIKGWVKNSAGGGVELVAEAEEDTLKQFLATLRKAMSHYISGEEMSSSPATGEFSRFEIVF